MRVPGKVQVGRGFRIAIVAAVAVASTPSAAVGAPPAPRLLVDNGAFTPESFVRQIATDRSDRFLMVSDFDTGLAFYDLSKGKLVNRFVGHSLAGDVAYQPALDRLVTTGDRTIKIWDVKGQRLERTINQGFHSQFMNSVYLDPSGRFVFAEKVKYQLPSGKAVKVYGRLSLLRDEKEKTFFLGDRYVRVDTTGRGTIFRISDDKAVGTFQARLPGPPASVHFDASRGEIYFGYPDGFTVHAVATGAEGRIDFSRAKVFALGSTTTDSCVTSDGRSLVTVSTEDAHLVILEKRDAGKATFIDNAREAHREPLRSSTVACLATRPQVVISVAGESGPRALPDRTADTLILYDVPSRKVVWRIEPRLLPMVEIALDRAGKQVGIRAGRDVHHILAENGLDPSDRGGLQRLFEASPEAEWDVRFRPEVRRENVPERLGFLWDRRTRWFSVGLDGDFRPREIPEKTFANDFLHPSHVPEQGDALLRSFKSPSTRFEAVPRAYNTYDIVEHLPDRAARKLFSIQDTLVTYEVAFSPDERMVALGGSGRQVSVYQIPSGRLLHRLRAPSYVEALAFTPDGRELALGTLKNEIWVFDLRSGAVTRKVSGFDGSCVDLAITGDGQTLVSLSGDGGLRFWDLRTGKLRVAAFYDPQLGFAAVTPAGYFDKSVHFDALLWNVDGVSYGLDQYFEAFYRPQLVRAAMRGAVDETLPTTASVGAPPTVRFVDPPSSTEDREVRLTVGISNRGGGIGSVRIYANGTAVRAEQQRGFVLDAGGPGEKTRVFEVPLSVGENRIQAVAFNADDSVQSAPAELRVSARYRPQSAAGLHAVVVGVQQYENPDLNLKFASDDAKLFAKTLSAASGGLYGVPRVTLLTEKSQTTRQNLEKVLASMQSIDPNDLFVFYVASHGVVDDGRFYLLTSNVGSISSGQLAKQALPQDQLANLIMSIPAQKKLIIIDTCSAAALGDAVQIAALGRGLTEATAIKVLSRAVGTTVLSASSASQRAIEGYKGQGLFTFVIVEGLRGAADLNKDGFVKTTELADFLDDEVPELAEKAFGQKQFPTVAPQGQAFPIARVAPVVSIGGPQH